MKRSVPGLAALAADDQTSPPDGLFLVRIEIAQYRRQASKAFVCWRFSVLEPRPHAGAPIVGRLYCTPKAMWKLAWFLKDFLYDPELLSADELDERALRGLVGVLNVSHSVVNGVSLVNLDGFAPASQWESIDNAGNAPSPPTSAVQPRGAGRRKR
jgi:hypothetical protein